MNEQGASEDILVRDFTWRKAPGKHPSRIGTTDVLVLEGFVDDVKYAHTLYVSRGFPEEDADLDSFLLEEFKRQHRHYLKSVRKAASN